jgi:hypothetical protein
MSHHDTSLTSRLLISLTIATLPAGALAQGAQVGGHIGIAVPLVTVTSDDTTNIADNTVIVNPIGVTVKLTDRVAVDFETQVVSPVDPRGDTSFVVAPGVIYNAGAAALGLRVAAAIGAPANVGVIPLINKGIADLGGGATWFIEAAFPTFLHSDPDPDVTFDVVLHTGIGF